MSEGRNIFTPYRSPRSGTRLELYLSDADKAKTGPSGGAWGPVQVTDLESGAVLRIRGATCGEGRCFCAAEVVKTVTPGDKPIKVLVEERA